MPASKILFNQAHIVNEGRVFVGDVLVEGEKISKVKDGALSVEEARGAEIVNAKGFWLMPGCVDDQVHFREPGLTHKADIATESAAAAAGGITSFMEMPNTIPQALTQELLQEKYERADEVSAVNYSFFMGASNGNIDEVLKTDPKRICGVKVFMGSSTGDMLVDEESVLEGIFKESPTLVATHCEDESIIRSNLAKAKERWGDNVPMNQHHIIRSAEACYRSSSKAVELASKLGTRLHILHISTAKELNLFEGDKTLSEKLITAEACIHHIWFTDGDYSDKGTYIKWNPAVKTEKDRAAIRAALLDGRIDVIATDHAPHTLEEKNRKYFSAPSGGPLVQHGLPAMLDLVIMPLVAFDSQFNRLGMGKGYYDRTFGENLRWRRPCLLGLAYASQQLTQLDATELDVPLDGVLTEEGITWRKKVLLGGKWLESYRWKTDQSRNIAI